VFPVPTTGYFNLKTVAPQNGLISIKVMDIEGRVKEILKAHSGQTVRFGHSYKSGTYLVEVTQGSFRKLVKLIKLN
jgi:hypothetical protein